MMHAYTMAIARFFGVTWLSAVAWLSDEEIEALGKEIGWTE